MFDRTAFTKTKKTKNAWKKKKKNCMGKKQNCMEKENCMY
jgi:hypothetical protein